MNKTVSINLGGQVFHIDEDAYQVLKEYLTALKKYFLKEEGGDEIVNDIEVRIAQLFSEALVDGKEAINLQDVELVIKEMGQPYEMDAESVDFDEKQEQEQKATGENGARRLFRDPDGKIVGGVCGGVGAYLGIDPVWLRLAFVVALLTFGGGLLFYIILWVVIPEARTPSEKLQMKGKPINVSNIEETIKSEFESLRDHLDSPNVEKGLNKAGNAFERAALLLVQLLTLIGKFLIRLLAVALLIAAAVAIFGLIIALLIGFGAINASFSIFLPMVFTSGLGMLVSQIALLLFFLVPLALLVILSLRLLFKVKPPMKSLGLGALALWIFSGLILALQAGIVLSEFHAEASEKEDLSIKISPKEVLYLDFIDEDEVPNAKVQYQFFDFEYYLDDDQISFSDVSYAIKPSADNEVHITVRKSSNGASYDDALQMAREIEYTFIYDDSTVFIPSLLSIPTDGAFRSQALHFEIFIPEGQELRFLSNTWAVRNRTPGMWSYHSEYKDKRFVMTDGQLVRVGQTEERHSETSELDLGDFDRIKVSGACSLQLSQANEYSIQVMEDDRRAAVVRVENNAGELFLEGQLGSSSTPAIVKVQLPNIEELRLDGASSLSARLADVDKLKLWLTNASSAFLDINASSLSAELSGASVLGLEGTLDTLHAAIAEASELKANDCTTRSASISAESFSKAKLTVLDALEANASGNSSVLYQGAAQVTAKAEDLSQIQRDN